MTPNSIDESKVKLISKDFACNCCRNVYCADISFHSFPNISMLNFHSNKLIGASKSCSMHLSKRGACNWFRVKFTKNLINFFSKVFSNDCFHIFETCLWHKLICGVKNFYIHVRNNKIHMSTSNHLREFDKSSSISLKCLF